MDVLKAKGNLLEYASGLNHKYELSKTVSDDYYEPGMMENLEQYWGVYDDSAKTLVLRLESKGLRYENRTKNLEKLAVGDEIQIIREETNPYNSNNFMIQNHSDSLGNLPADLCNVLAPLYDAGYAVIQAATVSYLEKIKERSRYAKQGVLFVELQIKLRGI